MHGGEEEEEDKDGMLFATNVKWGLNRVYCVDIAVSSCCSTVPHGMVWYGMVCLGHWRCGVVARSARCAPIWNRWQEGPFPLVLNCTQECRAWNVCRVGMCVCRCVWSTRYRIVLNRNSATQNKMVIFLGSHYITFLLSLSRKGPPDWTA